MLSAEPIATPGRPPDDTRVCIFAAQELVKHRNGGSLQVDSLPDKTERPAQAVDLVAHDDLGVIVAEHTAALVYGEQVNDNQRAYQLFAGFEERFGHELAAPGRYTLTIDPTHTRRLRQQDGIRLLDELETWVRAQELPNPDAISYAAHPIAATIGVASVTLYRRRCSLEEAGSLRAALVRQRGVPTQTAETIARAFRDKCPKLAIESARHLSSTTLLALERHDVQLGTPWELMRTTRTAARGLEEMGFEGIPDAIVWVDTSADVGGAPAEAHWMAYIAKNGSWSAAASEPPADDGGSRAPVWLNRWRALTTHGFRTSTPRSGC
jgi:hypothetical protein